MLNLLLVEDDLDLATAIIDYLEIESIQCDYAANGIAGLNLIKANNYQVIILDLNLPKMNGFDICQYMRNQGIDTPVLMLTARDSLHDKLAGFDAGTDDYLVKPFAMEELIARIKVLSHKRSNQIQKLSAFGIEIDLKEQLAYRDQQLLKLSPISFKILEVLIRESPKPVPREELMQRVWGEDQPDSNSLKVHVHNLRKKIDEGATITLLQTIPSYGFALKPKQ